MEAAPKQGGGGVRELDLGSTPLKVAMCPPKGLSGSTWKQGKPLVTKQSFQGTWTLTTLESVHPQKGDLYSSEF